MQFFKKFWNKVQGKDQADEANAPLETSKDTPWDDWEAIDAESSLDMKRVGDLNDAFNETHETLQRDTVMANLNVLKNIVGKPKEQSPDLRFSKIKEHLGEPECHETVRQERWVKNVVCPFCSSKRVQRIQQESHKSPYNYRYRCGKCKEEFDDDTDTPFEGGTPPISVWMQCWYLLGCTSSMEYIAAKLGISMKALEKMVDELQKTFNAKAPLTRFKSYNEWVKESEYFEKQLKQALKDKQQLIGNADVASTPKDTAEYRRQTKRRRTPTTPKKKN